MSVCGWVGGEKEEERVYVRMREDGTVKGPEKPGIFLYLY